MQENEDILAAPRAKIDEIDSQIINLLNQRACVAQEIGRLKGNSGTPVYRPQREAQVIQNVIAKSKGPLKDTGITAIYREIMSACRAVETVAKVAYLGPQGTFSQLALEKAFGSSVESLACDRIDEVFRAVEAGSADYGVVPIENSTEGSVNRTMDCLLKTNLSIIGECSIPIIHNLLTKSGNLDGIKKIYSHPQSLAQCIGWLNSHVPQLERVPVESNGEAARLAAEDPTAAAIASEKAANVFKLQTVASRIQDDASNRTRFVVLGKEKTSESANGKDKTSLIFSVPHVAGALFHALRPLEIHNVSMTRLDSRPARSGAWEYFFYCDIEGHSQNKAIAKVLDELKAGCAFFKNLGSYPAEAEFGPKKEGN